MLIFDLETDGLLDTVTKIHCLVIKGINPGETWKFIGGTEHEEIEDGLLFLENADAICGHNILRYDIPVIEKLYPWWKRPALIRDTIVCTRLIWPNLKELDFKHKTGLGGKHSLDAWGKRIGEYKGNFKGPWDTFTQEMLDYCVQDVEVTAKLWERIKSKNFSEEAIQLEHDFSEVMRLQEHHGFRFDVKKAHELHATLGQRRLVVERELQAIFPGWYEDMKVPAYYEIPTTGERFSTKKEAGKKAKLVVAGPPKQKHTPFNPASDDHVARVLTEKYGWKPKVFTDGGKPSVTEEVVSGLTFPEAKPFIEYKMLEKRLGMLAEGDNAWLKLEKNGRIHGQVDCMGTVTSRCSHKKPNMGQVVAIDKPYGKEMRELFCADGGGHVLVGADASGIQLRALAHYLSRWDQGTYVSLVTTGDVHTANQLAAGLHTRDQAKTFIYAFLLGAGDEKIGAIIEKGKAAGRALKRQFLEKLPAFRYLQRALEERVNEDESITGLDGRTMPVKTAHFALASLLQGFEAVIMKKAVCLFNAEMKQRGYVFGKDYAQVVMVHDEIQATCKKEIADELGKCFVRCIAGAGVHYASRCPLTGEYKIGQNWKETH